MEANSIRIARRDKALRKRAEYTAVYERGRTWSSKLVTLKALPTHSELTRFGYSVSKGVGKAVVRNKVRRRLREIARLAEVKPGWDIVLIARRETAAQDYRGLMESVEGLLARAQLLRESNVERPGPGAD